MRRSHPTIPLVLLAIILACAAATRAAEERPQTLGEAKAKEQVQKLAEVATLPIVTAKSPGDVLQMNIRENDLVVSTKLQPTDDAVVRAPGLSGLSKVRIATIGNDPNQPPANTFNFENIDYAVPNVIAVHTSVSQVPGQLMVTQDYDRLDDQVHSVQLIQQMRELNEGEPRVALYVQITAPPTVDLRLTAANIVELRRQHPAETALYLDPIFRTLRQDGLLSRVDPRLAWQVLSDVYSPSPQLESDLKAVVARLDSNSFAEREAASRELEKFGQPAALALMKMDRKGLSDEQLGRIDAFTATFKTVPKEEAQRLRRDPDFLLDCLYADDANIRTRALEQLQKALGHPIEFDVNAAPEARLAAINKLRASIGAVPTTQQKMRDE